MRHLDVVMHINIVCVIVLGPISLIRYHAPFAIWIVYCFHYTVLCSICSAFCKLFDVSYNNKVILNLFDCLLAYLLPHLIICVLCGVWMLGWLFDRTYRFLAFWVRSECSICSSQVNIWYVPHRGTTISNWFLESGEVSGLVRSCSTSASGSFPTGIIIKKISLHVYCSPCNKNTINKHLFEYIYIPVFKDAISATQLAIIGFQQARRSHWLANGALGIRSVHLDNAHPAYHLIDCWTAGTISCHSFPRVYVCYFGNILHSNKCE